MFSIESPLYWRFNANSAKTAHEICSWADHLCTVNLNGKVPVRSGTCEQTRHRLFIWLEKLIYN